MCGNNKIIMCEHKHREKAIVRADSVTTGSRDRANVRK